MGMTIDKAIEFYNGLECYTPQAKDARDIAIHTMRKYQKIEQIYERFQKDGGYYHHMAWLDTMQIVGNFESIDISSAREVVEDGNNDQHN